MIGRGIATLGLCALTAFVYYISRSEFSFLILVLVALLWIGFEVEFKRNQSM